MARFVKHEACPKCRENGRDRKGNNLGVYDDGSRYCFSCGYSVGSGFVNTVRRHTTSGQPTKALENYVALPEDCEPYYPARCLDWINKYDLTKNDLYANKVLWSEYFQRLIFPYYENNNLLGWQGRYFGEGDKPKWFSKGPLDAIYHIFNQDRTKNSLVLVEDIVSAIKIAKIGQSVMPIFGSHVSEKKLCHLKLITGSLSLFLDPDKYGYSVKVSNLSNSLGLPCRVISADRDPKDCSYGILKDLLTS